MSSKFFCLPARLSAGQNTNGPPMAGMGGRLGMRQKRRCPRSGNRRLRNVYRQQLGSAMQQSGAQQPRRCLWNRPQWRRGLQQGAGSQQATGAQQAGSGAQQAGSQAGAQQRRCQWNRPQWRRGLQQGAGAQQSGSGAQQAGSQAGAQQRRCLWNRPQWRRGLQQGAGSQQVGSGAQQAGSQQPPWPRWPCNSPNAEALEALAATMSPAAATTASSAKRFMGRTPTKRESGSNAKLARQPVDAANQVPPYFLGTNYDVVSAPHRPRLRQFALAPRCENSTQAGLKRLDAGQRLFRSCRTGVAGCCRQASDAPSPPLTARFARG
jgi:hypothetical protein